jgi:hypothetical protein
MSLVTAPKTHLGDKVEFRIYGDKYRGRVVSRPYESDGHLRVDVLATCDTVPTHGIRCDRLHIVSSREGGPQ